MFKRTLVPLAGLLFYIAFIVAFLRGVDCAAAWIAPNLRDTPRTFAVADHPDSSFRRIGALLVAITQLGHRGQLAKATDPVSGTHPKKEFTYQPTRTNASCKPLPPSSLL